MELAKLRPPELVAQLRNKWHEMFKAIRVGAQQDNPEWPPAQVLLKAEILIYCDERIAMGHELVEKRTVIEVRCTQ